jgi:hypothetical protein
VIQILSVDWDYFFPNPMWYDWGHKEEPLFMEFLWQIRATNRNLKTREWAVDQMRVDRNRRHNFWKKVCPDPNVAFLYVTESHKDIFDMLKGLSFGNMSVWNFDAHNDLSYSNRTTKECDNWAWSFRFSPPVSTMRYPQSYRLGSMLCLCVGHQRGRLAGVTMRG